jgi:hypothetical protein
MENEKTLNQETNMTPEQAKIIDKKIEEIAEILYQNTDVEQLEDFEKVELIVRKQILAHVAPKIGNFFLTMPGGKKQEEKEQSKVVLEKLTYQTNKQKD